ncbi:MAG: hypothetical protein CL908_06240 [Deltaproteobacteria bacterium]|nr:hypothetical protein [Deltaproteobacteria bacterium]
MKGSIGSCGIRGIVLFACLCGGVVGQGEVQRVDEKIDALRADYEQRIEALRNDYEGRLRVLEARVGGLHDELADATASDRDRTLERSITAVLHQDERGLHEPGAVGAPRNALNPTISLVGDFLLVASDRDDSFERLDQFRLRTVELQVAGRIDEYVSYAAYIHLDESDVELEEAVAVWDHGMPDTFTLKGGRYNIDFGLISALHDHHLPFVDKPQVIQEYLGGSLRGTGLELHHRLRLGDHDFVRWSAGTVNMLEGDGHAVFGPSSDEEHGDDGGPEPFGERDLDNFAFTARVMASFETSEHSTLDVGTSVAYAPEVRAFFETPAGPVEFNDLERFVFGSDVMFEWHDPATHRALTLSGEFLLSHGDFAEDLDAPGVPTLMRNVTSVGFYAYAEFALDDHWSVGASGGWYEHAEDSRLDSWDTGVFITYRITPANRLRLEFRHFDDPTEDFWGVMLQWTVTLGAHDHWGHDTHRHQ